MELAVGIRDLPLAEQFIVLNDPEECHYGADDGNGHEDLSDAEAPEHERLATDHQRQHIEQIDGGSCRPGLVLRGKG